MTKAEVGRALGWNVNTVTAYLQDYPERLGKYIGTYNGSLVIREDAIPVFRGLKEEKHKRKEKYYGT